MADNPLTLLAMLNVKVDRRHDRRAWLPDAFSRLVDAAHTGQAEVCIPVLARAIMVSLAAWTGYCKGESGRLTKWSLRPDDLPPTLPVAAANSKQSQLRPRSWPGIPTFG
jgi:hypothetical protein